MKKTNLLKWTPQMEKEREIIKSSPANKEELNDPVVKKALERKDYTYFLYIPLCVAGWRGKYNAYSSEDKDIQAALPKGYKLVAWYGWGGSGWLAQTKKISK